MLKTAALMSHRTLFAACASASVLGLTACGEGNSDDATKSAKTIKVVLTDKGCSPAKLTAPAGPLTIAVSNSASSDVTEMELKDASGLIVGERENIAPGLSGSFSVNAKPGKYTMSCPNGDQEDNGALLITGNAVSSSGGAPSQLLDKAVASYRAYVVKETAALLAGTRQFVVALQQGDTQKAKDLFGTVRRHYEAIEPVAESFGDLDPAIDARVNDVPSIKQWTGFHRIERTLWTHDSTDGTAPYAKRLLADVTELSNKVDTLHLEAPQVANGAVELLNEVAGSKITGEEDRYSHTDLSDFQGNLSGARVAFEQLRPALVAQGKAALANEIAARFAAVQQGLDVYRRDTPLGFAYYSELTPADRKRFAQQVDALAEPLSTVAAQVTG